MRIFFVTLSSVIGFIGLVFIVRGGMHPNTYQKTLEESKSAAQVTQIYTEATYAIVIGIGIVSLAILIALIGIGIRFHRNKPLNPEAQSIDDPET